MKGSNLLLSDTQSNDSSQDTEESTALQKKRERQRRYRERNREVLRQREVDRKYRQQNLKSAADLHEMQDLLVDITERVEQKNAIEKKKERQKRYRERNKEKLKQRELERKRRRQKSEAVAESSTSSYTDCTEIIYVPIDDEISTNSLSLDGSEETEDPFIEITERNLRCQASGNEAQMLNNHSKCRCHKLAHKHLSDSFKNNQYGYACSICDRLWFEKDLKPPANMINTSTTDVDIPKVVEIEVPALNYNPALQVHNNITQDASNPLLQVHNNITQDARNYNPGLQVQNNIIQDARNYNPLFQVHNNITQDASNPLLQVHNNITQDARNYNPGLPVQNNIIEDAPSTAKEIMLQQRVHILEKSLEKVEKISRTRLLRITQLRKELRRLKNNHV